MSEQRCAVVAILGAPNAGKSTLVNTLVGAKVAAVTQKVQTTRTLVRGIAMRDDVQLVLIDTPGVFAPTKRLERAMVAAAWSALEGADAVVHVVDAPAHANKGTAAERHSVEDAKSITAALDQREIDSILVLNKVDAVARPALLEVTRELVEQGRYTDVFMISAKRGDGVDDLARTLAGRAPEGPWLFPEDQTMDAPARVLAAEITREKAFLRLHEELPYELTVETDAWEERKDGSVKIDQTIFVARESQRKIAIGAKGQSIKTIGEMARKDLEEVLGRRVHLFLHVKVAENW
ncbi:MAG: GTPase Era, partial [Proteobacteria bacterium]|nr:GTPase Era [Pseudomonadota bacterium]